MTDQTSATGTYMMSIQASTSNRRQCDIEKSKGDFHNPVAEQHPTDPANSDSQSGQVHLALTLTLAPLGLLAANTIPHTITENCRVTRYPSNGRSLGEPPATGS